jgi:hypothetical protein
MEKRVKDHFIVTALAIKIKEFLIISETMLVVHKVM